jgi:hypothetical protein
MSANAPLTNLEIVDAIKSRELIVLSDYTQSVIKTSGITLLFSYSRNDTFSLNMAFEIAKLIFAPEFANVHFCFIDLGNPNTDQLIKQIGFGRTYPACYFYRNGNRLMTLAFSTKNMDACVEQIKKKLIMFNK